MNTIDKVLLEWSLKTDKGYPDVNLKEDMDLFESMFGFRLEEEEESSINRDSNDKYTIDSIKNLLDANKDKLNPDQVKKLFKFINNVGKGYTTVLENILRKKNLGEDQIKLVVFVASRNNVEEKMINALKNSNNTFNSTVGNSGDNLIQKLSNSSNIPKDVVRQLFDLTAGKGQRTVGKGEIVLKSTLYDTYDPPKLDLGTEDGIIELKTTKAILSPLPSLSKNSVITLLKKVFDKIEIASGPWLIELRNALEQVDNPETYLKVFINQLYQDYVTLDRSTIASIGKNNFIEELKLDITSKLAEKYLNKEDINKIMFIENTGNSYITLSTKNINKETFRKNFIIAGFSDLNPRVSYKF